MIRLVGSLAKIFLDEDPVNPPHTRGSMLRGEEYSFQAAYTDRPGHRREIMNVDARIHFDGNSSNIQGASATQGDPGASEAPGSLKTPEAPEAWTRVPWIRLYRVGLVPSELPCHPDQDDGVLRRTPGLYPDLLEPLEEDEPVIGVAGQWRSVWIAVRPPADIAPGGYRIRISFTGAAESGSPGQELEAAVFHLKILAADLPPQRLLFTDWFHTDCLADWYGMEVFSERYWAITAEYLRMERAAGRAGHP